MPRESNLAGCTQVVAAGGGTPDRPCGLNIVMFMKTESPPGGRFKEPCSPYIYTPIKLPGWAPP